MEERGCGGGAVAETREGFWSGEWGYRHALLAVTGLVFAGWCVQFAGSGNPLQAPSWPVNFYSLLAFVAWVFLLSLSGDKVAVWLGGVPFAMASILWLGILGAVGGIVPQVSEGAGGIVRALGLNHIFQSVPLVVAMLALLTNLGVAGLRRVRSFGVAAWFFSLNHLGLWVTLAAMLFGAGDLIRARMVVSEGHAEALVVDEKGRHGYLPFGILLQRFYVDQYGEESGRPGAPKRFVADVTLLEKGGVHQTATIEVNRPVRKDGWALYVINYELSPEGATDQCVIEAVKDPWLPGVYAGVFLMLGGAFAMLFRNPFAGRAL